MGGGGTRQGMKRPSVGPARALWRKPGLPSGRGINTLPLLNPPSELMKTHARLVILLFTGLLAMLSGAGVKLVAAPVEVANKAGQSMTVEVLAYTASSGNVRIQRTSDGQIFNSKIDLFDAASQERIIANAPKELAKFEMDVSVGKKRRDIGSSSYLENMTITTSVKVANQSRDIDLDETDFTILLVARNSSRYADRSQDWYKLLSTQKFSTKLAAGESSEHELKPIETAYDSDKDSSNVGGWEFEGYLLVAQDKSGKVIATKTSLGTVSTTTVKEEKLILQAIKLPEGIETNHDLTPRGR